MVNRPTSLSARYQFASRQRPAKPDGVYQSTPLHATEGPLRRGSGTSVGGFLETRLTSTNARPPEAPSQGCHTSRIPSMGAAADPAIEPICLLIADRIHVRFRHPGALADFATGDGQARPRASGDIRAVWAEGNYDPRHTNARRFTVRVLFGPEAGQPNDVDVADWVGYVVEQAVFAIDVILRSRTTP